MNTRLSENAKIIKDKYENYHWFQGVEANDELNELDVITSDGMTDSALLDLIQELNKLGSLYVTEQTDIDYEDEGPDDIKYMNIYYFMMPKD